MKKKNIDHQIQEIKFGIRRYRYCVYELIMMKKKKMKKGDTLNLSCINSNVANKRNKEEERKKSRKKEKKRSKMI